MSVDKSLKRRNRLSRSRNVLQRHERIDQMKTQEKWVEGQSPIGLAKTRVIKIATGKKKKKAKDEEDPKDPKAADPKAAAAKPAKK